MSDLEQVIGETGKLLSTRLDRENRDVMHVKN